jgi:hypothetical protein
MNRTILYFIPILLFFQFCENRLENKPYKVNNYLQVKSMLDSINSLPESDLLTTWRNEITFYDSVGKKQIVFVGCSHSSSDTTHPQYLIMEDLFNKTKPQLAFNEGGDWGLKGKFKNKREAIQDRSGEVGFLQYLCDKQNIPMLNGDMSEMAEFQMMFKGKNFDLAYLIYALERFVNLYKHGVYPNITIEDAFQKYFIVQQLQAYKIPLTDEQKSFSYFKKVYLQYFKTPFILEKTEPIDNYYLEDKGPLGDIHRRSKVVRDSVLLSKIDSALYKVDRVFVAFGASHIVAIKPALKQILEKHKE